MQLLRPDDRIAQRAETPANPLAADDNVARKAKATASSYHPKCPPVGAINGVVGGLPGNMADEWSAEGEHVGAWLRLTWEDPQCIDRVWLFDRPSAKVQIVAAELCFSDGTVIAVAELPDDAKKGLEVCFAAKTITWLDVRVTGTKSDHPFIGLSEVAAFATAE